MKEQKVPQSEINKLVNRLNDFQNLRAMPKASMSIFSYRNVKTNQVITYMIYKNGSLTIYEDIIAGIPNEFRVKVITALKDLAILL